MEKFIYLDKDCFCLKSSEKGYLEGIYDLYTNLINSTEDDKYGLDIFLAEQNDDEYLFITYESLFQSKMLYNLTR